MTKHQDKKPVIWASYAFITLSNAVRASMVKRNVDYCLLKVNDKCVLKYMLQFLYTIYYNSNVQ